MEAVRQSLGLSVGDVWLAYLSLGGNAPADALESWLRGEGEPTAYDYNLVAHAMNEALVDRGLDRSIPYQDGD